MAASPVSPSRSNPGDDSFDRISHRRVREELKDEKIEKVGTIDVKLSGLVEPWDVFVTRGKALPYGYNDSGRVLVGPPDDPLAGLAWSEEYGKRYIHHVWVDPDARHRGLGKALVELYREHVDTKVVFSGPFSPGGRRLAESVGAKIINANPRSRARLVNPWS